jgi:hypothetical protein
MRIDDWPGYGDVPGYPAGSIYNALCKRVNEVTIWSKCYRDHPEYWTDLDALGAFYSELNEAGALMVGWHKDHADWRLDKAWLYCERAERLWEAERQRVFKLRAERNSSAYKGLAARLSKLPIITDGEGGMYDVAYDALNSAWRILETFDYRGAEAVVEAAERKARVLPPRTTSV